MFGLIGQTPASIGSCISPRRPGCGIRWSTRTPMCRRTSWAIWSSRRRRGGSRPRASRLRQLVLGLWRQPMLPVLRDRPGRYAALALCRDQAGRRADEPRLRASLRLPQTGLRFFTVYGPWGRPDMAYYAFARAIAAGEPITVYDGGRLRRDFTYVDDIVAGVLGCLDRPPEGDGSGAAAQYRQQSERRVSRSSSFWSRSSGARPYPGHPEAAGRCRGDLRLCRCDRRPDRLRPGTPLRSAFPASWPGSRLGTNRARKAVRRQLALDPPRRWD